MSRESTRPRALWDTVLTALKLYCDQETFTNLIQPVKLLRYDSKDESVVISIPLDVSLSRFENDAKPVLEKAFANTIGVVPHICIESCNETSTNISQQSISGRFHPVRKAPEKSTEKSAHVTANGRALNFDYTFDQFVVGPSNRMAEAAARAVVEQPGRAYNPLFVHGNVGLGKTHLLQAICHGALEKEPNTKIRYLSCEQFVNDFIEAMKGGHYTSFRSAFRGIDLLIIDDIHFLSSKEQMQEEFFHTFNDLYNANKQIVISSDSSPKEIPEMEDRLISRFLWGLPVKIDAPVVETREVIVMKKAEQRGVELPRNVVEFIAQTITTNIRELEGAVIQVAAMANMLDRPISLSIAQEALKNMVSSTALRRTSIDDIVEMTCKHFGVRLSDLQSQRRSRSVTLPRQVAMFLAKELTNKTLSEIGGFFGGRDHTTVLHSVRKIKESLAESDELAQRVTLIKRDIDREPATGRF